MLQFYDQWTAHMTDDVAFYVRHAVEVEGPVVELGAGNGRVSLAIARAGQEVVAVDISDAMLAEGARRSGQEHLSERIRWVHADMRTYVAAPATSMVIIPFRSFMHLLTTEDQLLALRSVFASLRPDGRLICNLFTPDPVRIATLDRQRRLQATYTDEFGRRCEVYATPVNELATQRLDVRAELEVYDGPRMIDSTETTLSLRQIYRYEFEHLLARTGFEVEALYGDFNEKPYGPGPDEMIWIARKP
jgi:SAM-dependent methyltransferase